MNLLHVASRMWRRRPWTGKERGAPGDTPAESAVERLDSGAEGETAGPSRTEVAERLRSVIDPEVGINIVDLGLIYDLEVVDQVVTVRLTMTTPACPMSDFIRNEVGRALRRVPGVRRGITELVWDPSWSPQMIDPEVSVRRFGVRVKRNEDDSGERRATPSPLT